MSASAEGGPTMILFLYGEEPFQVREKLEQIRAKAAGQGTDASSVRELTPGEDDVDAVRQAVSGGSLFAEKSLVILRNWLLEGTPEQGEQLAEALASAPAETIVAVVEFGQPDKRRAGFKRIIKLAEKSWDFPAMDETQAANWVRQRVKAQGYAIAPPAVHRLVTAVGTSAWALAMELDKLAVASDQEITPELVDELVVAEARTDIFALVDALSKRDAKTALRLLNGLREAGEPALKTFGLIVWQYRVLLGVLTMAGQGANDAVMAKTLGLHPFVARKAKAQAARFTERELRDIYHELTDLDLSMKTGRRDPDTALELFILEHCERETAVR